MKTERAMTVTQGQNVRSKVKAAEMRYFSEKCRNIGESGILHNGRSGEHTFGCLGDVGGLCNFSSI